MVISQSFIFGIEKRIYGKTAREGVRYRERGLRQREGMWDRERGSVGQSEEVWIVERYHIQ